MHMSMMMLLVITMAHAVFLTSRTVIYKMQEMGISKESESTEKGRPVHVEHDIFKVGKTESLMHPVVNSLPYLHTTRSGMNASFL